MLASHSLRSNRLRKQGWLGVMSSIIVRFGRQGVFLSFAPPAGIAQGPLLVGAPQAVRDPFLVIEEVHDALDFLAQSRRVGHGQQIGSVDHGPGRREMDMAVDEAGQDEFSPEIEDARLGTDIPLRLPVGSADRRDLVARDDEGPGRGHGRIDGIDVAVQKDKVGRGGLLGAAREAGETTRIRPRKHR